MYHQLLLAGLLALLATIGCDNEQGGSPTTPGDDMTDTLEGDPGGPAGEPFAYFPLDVGSRWNFIDFRGNFRSYTIDRDTMIDGEQYFVLEFPDRRPAYMRRDGSRIIAIDSNVGAPYTYLQQADAGYSWIVRYVNPGGDSSHDRAIFTIDEYLDTYEEWGLTYHDVMQVSVRFQGLVGEKWYSIPGSGGTLYLAQGIGPVQILHPLSRRGDLQQILSHTIPGGTAGVDTTEDHDPDLVEGGWCSAKLDGEDWVPKNISYYVDGSSYEFNIWQWLDRPGSRLRFHLRTIDVGTYDLDDYDFDSFFLYIGSSWSGATSATVSITRNNSRELAGTFEVTFGNGFTFTDGEFVIEK